MLPRYCSCGLVWFIWTWRLTSCLGRLSTVRRWIHGDQSWPFPPFNESVVLKKQQKKVLVLYEWYSGLCFSIWANPASRNAAECAGWHRPPSPMAAAAARLSGRWKYAWLHLVLWGSCGEKGQVELMDYSRTQWGCRLSNAAGCLFRTGHFYDNLSQATAGVQEGPGAVTSVPRLCGIYSKQNPFSGYFRLF